MDGHLIDLQSFRNRDIEFKKEDKTYYVSLCGPAKKCKNSTMAACEIESSGNIKSIGDIITQRIHYDTRSKKLLGRMHLGTGKRSMRKL